MSSHVTIAIRDIAPPSPSTSGRPTSVPGLRPRYHPYDYAAHVRDRDGNKLCVVCHAARRTAREQVTARRADRF